jgi:hypothetical protein
MVDSFRADLNPDGAAPAAGEADGNALGPRRDQVGLLVTLTAVAVVTVALASVAGRWGGLAIVAGAIGIALAAARHTGATPAAARRAGAIGALMLLIPAFIWFIAHPTAGNVHEAPPSEAPQPTTVDAFLVSARESTDFPDPDYVLVGAGQAICSELADVGQSRVRMNLAQSSFSVQQQQALLDAALDHLC